MPEVHENLVQACLDEYDNYLPTLYVNGSASKHFIDDFKRQYQNHWLAVFYDGVPSQLSDAHLSALAEDVQVTYHIFLEGAVSNDFMRRFPVEKRVVVKDRFNRVKNSAFPNDEFFSDMHRNVPGADFAGFGDYSIVGSAYSDDGGPAYAVALHHVYRNDAQHGNIHIRHFVSDRTDSTADVSGKFLEALTKLVTALPSLGRSNHTTMCDKYISIYSTQQSPGLGYAKKMAIKHHFEVMLKILDGVPSGP